MGHAGEIAAKGVERFDQTHLGQGPNILSFGFGIEHSMQVIKRLCDTGIAAGGFEHAFGGSDNLTPLFAEERNEGIGIFGAPSAQSEGFGLE